MTGFPEIRTHKLKEHLSEEVISVRGLCKSFGNNKVLDHFDLSLYRGENLVVLGKSGSGK